MSCKGESHRRRDIVCQDSSVSADREKYAFAAAAECVEEFMESIHEAGAILDNERERRQLFDRLWRSIVSRWHERTEEDHRNEPFTEEEFGRIPEKYSFYRSRYENGRYIDAYGTTLTLAAVCDDFAFCCQIGDGSCVVISADGSVTEPVPEDPRCHDNVTTSMCQDDAVLSARFCYFSKNELPAAIFIGTDGIENSYWSSEQLHGFYCGLALTIAENDLDEGVRQLREFLPEMTRKGSGDDVSCAGIVDTSALNECQEMLKRSVNAQQEAAPGEADVTEGQ